MAGPLAGLRVVELVALGPAPFAAMVLADLGAEVVQVHRPPAGDPADQPVGDPAAGDPSQVLSRGKRSIAVDLRTPEGRELVLRLVADADVVLEGFRPGVVERLGVGPDECLARNPGLVYGRMTGWGQEGPLSRTAGHDIDYLALTGALWAIGRPPAPPVPPVNLVADFGGGAMVLVAGVLAALLSVRSGGPGQVIDAAMVDGAALLTTLVWGLRAQGLWGDRRGENLLDGGAPFYDVYECADGRFLAVGALEPQFYAELVQRTGFDDGGLAQLDVARWPQLRVRWAELFASRSRDEWVELLEGSDTCVAPVLDWDEASEHPHMRARGTFVDVAGVRQPAPAPRFSVTPAPTPAAPVAVGCDTDGVLSALGVTPEEVARLRAAGVVR